MMNNQMRSIISVTVHLSVVPKVLYNTVLWICGCSGLESVLSLKCLVSHYLHHMLKSVGYMFQPILTPWPDLTPSQNGPGPT